MKLFNKGLNQNTRGRTGMKMGIKSILTGLLLVGSIEAKAADMAQDLRISDQCTPACSSVIVKLEKLDGTPLNSFTAAVSGDGTFSVRVPKDQIDSQLQAALSSEQVFVKYVVDGADQPRKELTAVPLASLASSVPASGIQGQIPASKISNLPDLTGPKGETGKQGDRGDTGAAGSNGHDGSNGKDGKNGTDGTNGQDGATGKDGKNGKDGKDGNNGQDGAPGAPGAAGSQIMSGTAAPQLTDGVVGDYFLNTATGDLYKKSLIGWSVSLNMKAPVSTDASVLTTGTLSDSRLSSNVLLTSSSIPASKITGTLALNQVPGNVILSDGNNKILQYNGSNLTNLDASKITGSQNLPASVLPGTVVQADINSGKISSSVIPSNYLTTSSGVPAANVSGAGQLPDSVLSTNVVLKDSTSHKIAASDLPAVLASSTIDGTHVTGAISSSVLPSNIPAVLITGLLNSATVPAAAVQGSLTNSTVPPSRLESGALPALDGSLLTNLSAGNLVGSLPAIDGSRLIGIQGSTSVVSSNVIGITDGSASPAGRVGETVYPVALGAGAIGSQQTIQGTGQTGTATYITGAVLTLTPGVWRISASIPAEADGSAPNETKPWVMLTDNTGARIGNSQRYWYVPNGQQVIHSEAIDEVVNITTTTDFKLRGYRVGGGTFIVFFDSTYGNMSFYATRIR
jgi:Collagen triple helix repeat (20 copies)